MINPRTYENYAYDLVDAAEGVVLGVGISLREAAVLMINNPDSVLVAQDLVEKTALNLARQWDNNWRLWSDTTLGSAYLRGISHADSEFKKLLDDGERINSTPNQHISNSTPLITGNGGNQAPPNTRVPDGFDRYPNHLTFYEVFRAAAYESMEGTDLQILRASQDEFRQLAIQVGDQRFRESDIFTKEQIMQELLNEYARKGLKTVTYNDGRRISLDVYADMVGRTVSGRAAIQATLNRYEEYGYDLMRITQHFITCPLCVPWEGKIVSHSGSDSNYPSLQHAIDEGLFHPNCAHDIVAYIPGVSKDLRFSVDPNVQRMIDEHGYEQAQIIAYEAQQRQRTIEKHIRNWKRQEVVSLNE